MRPARVATGTFDSCDRFTIIAKARSALGRMPRRAQLLDLEAGRQIVHLGQRLLRLRGLDLGGLLGRVGQERIPAAWGGRGRVLRLAGRRRIDPAVLGGGGTRASDASEQAAHARRGVTVAPNCRV